MNNKTVLNNSLEEVLKERIEQNQSIFTEEERKFIKCNFKLMKKIYFLGICDIKL